MIYNDCRDRNKTSNSNCKNTINSNTTFVTNFDTKDRNRYNQAIELYKMQTGDDSLYIKSEAYDLDIVVKLFKNFNFFFRCFGYKRNIFVFFLVPNAD